MAIGFVQKKSYGWGFPHQPPPIVSVSSQIFTLGQALFDKFPLPLDLNDLFYTLGHHVGADQAQERPVRTAQTFHFQTMLAWDIDGVDQSRENILSIGAVVAEILRIPPLAIVLVATGGGAHALVHLKNIIRNVTFFKENKHYYVEICEQIKKGLTARGIAYEKIDQQIFEPARILRLPGSINNKPGLPPRPCVLIQHEGIQVDIDLKVISGLGELEESHISPHELRRNYPKPDFAEMMKECRFLQWVTESPQEVHEPHVFPAFSLLAACDPDTKVVLAGSEKNANEVAQHVFKNATSSKSLAGSDFANKWEQSAKYGAPKCDTVNEAWGKCSTCPHFSKIKTPLALKSREHIGSEATGFWVLNSKGNPARPHYEDLYKVFSNEFFYLSTNEERILTWDATQYKPKSQLNIKSWLEKKMVPPDYLLEAHRSEFVAKIKAKGVIDVELERKLFQDSIKGKLNCKNGVLDIRTGELIPHTPKFGFKYVLPYDYTPGLTSEYFIDWLGTITQDRSELMESLLDLMGYTLWPDYDDHVFAFFIGEGKNGKSTLIKIIAAMVGEMNYSSVNISQLTRNRFAPAALEGKLVNLSEESSGVELDYAEMNTIKNLSAGGEMFVEEKLKQGYSFTNKAKLIFSANKPPRFLEKGEALKRRLLTIPFDHTIDVIDDSVGDRLIEEVPAIMSMLINRIQNNIKANDGKFVVNRGGSTAANAQRNLMTAGNTAIEWAKECIESSSEIPLDCYLPVNEAYASYKDWCEESGYRNPMNKIIFGRTMVEFVISKACKDSDFVKRVKKITTRVYPRTRMKDEAKNVD